MGHALKTKKNVFGFWWALPFSSLNHDTVYCFFNPSAQPTNYESTVNVKNPVCDSSEKSKMTNIFKTHIRDYYVQNIYLNFFLGGGENLENS